MPTSSTAWAPSKSSLNGRWTLPVESLSSLASGMYRTSGRPWPSSVSTRLFHWSAVVGWYVLSAANSWSVDASTTPKVSCRPCLTGTVEAARMNRRTEP